MARALGIIPARGGSKGLPNKNLMRLGARMTLLIALAAHRSEGEWIAR